MMSNSPPPADISGYEPPQSLWELVENNVPESESEEVKKMMGESLVEQSLELHEEIKMLLEIWQEYREETDEMSAKRTFLPEPPAARERLKQEIRFFVDSIREKGNINGRDWEKVLSRHNSEVLDYVMENKRPDSTGSRPSTARSSRDGRETPMRSTPSDRMSGCSNMSVEVDSISDKLNVNKFEEVCQHLRETLEDEVQQLLDDIKFLQGCLDDEANYRANSSMDTIEPSLADMRQERSKLEKDYIGNELSRDIMQGKGMEPLNAAPVRKSPQMLVPATTGKMRPSPPARKTSTPPGTQRPQPIKASHQLGTQVLTIDSNLSTSGEENPANTSVRRAGTASCKVSKARTIYRTENDNTISHLTIKTGRGNVLPSANLVKVGSIPAPQQNGDCSGNVMKHTPTPPSSAKPVHQGRPTSADRFRKMVIQCRDTT